MHFEYQDYHERVELINTTKELIFEISCIEFESEFGKLSYFRGFNFLYTAQRDTIMIPLQKRFRMTMMVKKRRMAANILKKKHSIVLGPNII